MSFLAFTLNIGNLGAEKLGENNVEVFKNG